MSSLLSIGLMKLLEIVSSVSSARKIVAGKLDGQALTDVSGSVGLSISWPIAIEIDSCWAGGHTVTGKRQLFRDVGNVTIDSHGMVTPDWDLHAKVSDGLKLRIAYVAQYSDAAGTHHELALYAFVSLLDAIDIVRHRDA